jgi:hypothetical protein
MAKEYSTSRQTLTITSLRKMGFSFRKNRKTSKYRNELNWIEFFRLNYLLFFYFWMRSRCWAPDATRTRPSACISSLTAYHLLIVFVAFFSPPPPPSFCYVLWTSFRLIDNHVDTRRDVREKLVPGWKSISSGSSADLLSLLLPQR